MKRATLIFAIYFALGFSAFAQAKPEPAPQLSTADKIALQSLEKQKQDDQQQFMQSVQTERAIAQEFQTAHPGWHLNQVNFQVEKDVVPEKAPAKTPAKPAPRK